MKIILLQDVDSVGKRLEVVEVADGHARNYLIPEGLAMLATDEAVEWVEAQREVLEKKAEQELQGSQQLASKLDGLELSIPMKVGEAGQLFESVSAQKISDKMKEMGYDIRPDRVKLQDPIKDLGEYPVRISLDHNLDAEITVVVVEEA